MAQDADRNSQGRLKSDYMADYGWQFTLRPAETALLIIDMQYATGCRTAGLGRNLIEQGKAELGKWRFDRIEQLVVPNQQRLLALFRRHGLRILYMTLGSELPDFSDVPPHLRPVTASADNWRGNRNHDILDELKPQPGEVVLNKTTASAFVSSGIDEILRIWGIRQLLLTGISTNMCVESTGRDAADRGYQCVLIDDACACAKEEYHRTTLVNFERLFGRVATTNAVLSELEASVGGAGRA